MAVFAVGVAGPGGVEVRGLHSYFVPKRPGPGLCSIFFLHGDAVVRMGDEACEIPYPWGRRAG
jgi:hypothetical protein